MPKTKGNALAKRVARMASFAQAATSKLLRWHNQIVFHRKYVRHAVGAKAGHDLIGLVVGHAFQRYISVFDNDVNRGNGRLRVARQCRLTVDGAEQGATQLIVWDEMDQPASTPEAGPDSGSGNPPKLPTCRGPWSCGLKTRSYNNS